MTNYVGLLRAVNLGGSTKLTMAALRDVLRRLGLDGVQTLLQSGNFVFRTTGRTPDELERMLETGVTNRLGLTTDIFVRTASEWNGIVERNPFPDAAKQDPAHLVVTVLKAAPSPTEWRALGHSIRGRETVRGEGRSAFVIYPDGIGTSKLTLSLIECKLGTRGTSRNWNTVQKLNELMAG